MMKCNLIITDTEYFGQVALLRCALTFVKVTSFTSRVGRAGQHAKRFVKKYDFEIENITYS